MLKIVENEIGASHAKMQQVTPYFVDFLRDPVEDDEGIIWDEHPTFYEKVTSN